MTNPKNLPQSWPFSVKVCGDDQRAVDEPTEVEPHVVDGRIVGYSLKPRRPPTPRTAKLKHQAIDLSTLDDAPY